MNRYFSLFGIIGASILFFACQQPTSQQTATAVFANDIDFSCGMKVRADYTDTCHYKGKVYGFCSASCKEEFQADPETFLNKETK